MAAIHQYRYRDVNACAPELPTEVRCPSTPARPGEASHVEAAGSHRSSSLRPPATIMHRVQPRMRSYSANHAWAAVPPSAHRQHQSLPMPRTRTRCHYSCRRGRQSGRRSSCIRRSQRCVVDTESRGHVPDLGGPAAVDAYGTTWSGRSPSVADFHVAVHRRV